MQYFLEGLLLGLAYAMPIGAQNIFVIQSAAAEGIPRSLRTAAVVSFFDVSLSLACFFGLGMLLTRFHFIQALLVVVGCFFLLNLGYKLIVSPAEIDLRKEGGSLSLTSIVRSCFVLTWFNPHALIDGSLLFGTYRASMEQGAILPFLVGVMLASPLWFFSLTGVVGSLRSMVPASFFRALNTGCGVVLILFGLKLGYLSVGFLRSLIV